MKVAVNRKILTAAGEPAQSQFTFLFIFSGYLSYLLIGLFMYGVCNDPVNITKYSVKSRSDW
jgi:hypothetical protein